MPWRYIPKTTSITSALFGNHATFGGCNIFVVKGMLKNTSGLSDLYHTVFWLNRDNFITQDGPKLCSWDATRDDARILMWSTTCAKLSLRWLKMEKKAKMEPLVVSTWLKTLWLIYEIYLFACLFWDAVPRSRRQLVRCSYEYFSYSGLWSRTSCLAVSWNFLARAWGEVAEETKHFLTF